MADNFKENAQSLMEPKTDKELKQAQREAKDQAMIDRIKARISQLDEGRALIELLDLNNVSIAFDTQLSVPGTCMNSLNYNGTDDGLPSVSAIEISINPHFFVYDEDQIMGVLLHEMWHAKQTLQGYSGIRGDTPVEDVCFFKVLIEADAESFSLEFCYKLKLSGDIKPWDNHMDFFGAKLAYIDEIELFGDHMLNNGGARLEAFDRIFKRKWLKDSYHEKAIEEWAMITKLPIEPSGKNFDLNYFKNIALLSEVNYLESGVFLFNDAYREISHENQKLIDEYRSEDLCAKKPEKRRTKNLSMG